MHRNGLDEVIRQTRRRVEQGDCPTIPPFRVSTLEEAICDLAAENEQLRKAVDLIGAPGCW